ncbi:hypothetical protein Kisp01_27460 [Kineosporia sp. NBRC 101677]|nr:hypothetical protein Kisp01_27460 [Kineosporia sp. NBRC 101677]
MSITGFSPQAVRSNAEAEQTVTLIERLLMLYAVAWIYEGALRKWIVPSLGSQLYFIRDALLLLIIICIL